LPNKKSPAPTKQDRTGHIYRTAAEIMCRKGYEATSMNDIAEAVGLTKAGIYHYISGKEKLLFAIMSYAMDIVDEHVIAPARSIPDPEERVRTIIERHANRIIEAGGAITILLEEMYALTPAHRRIIRARKRAYFELLRDALVDLSKEGKLAAVDPSVAAFNIFGMITFLSRWYRRDGRLTAEQVRAHVREFGMNAVLGRASC